MPPTPNWKLETNGSFRSRNTLAGSSLVAWQGILAVHDCKLSNPNSPQRQRSARIRNRETPARFTPTKLWQAAGIGWADVTALSKKPCGISHSKGTSQPPASPVSTHPKQGNPSKIRAQRVATWLAEPLPFGTLKAKVDG